VRCRLERLKGPEIEAYVLRRLEVASPNSQSRVIFSKPAIAAIERYSQGIPRLMNTICENALAIGCASQTPIVNAKIIEEVANHFGFREEIPSSPDGNYHLGPVEPAEAFSGQAQTLSAGRRTPARVMNMP
jgi:general secretion pathway protein A